MNPQHNEWIILLEINRCSSQDTLEHSSGISQVKLVVLLGGSWPQIIGDLLVHLKSSFYHVSCKNLEILLKFILDKELLEDLLEDSCEGLVV